jgi:hypothetical protein
VDIVHTTGVFRHNVQWCCCLHLSSCADTASAHKYKLYSNVMRFGGVPIFPIYRRIHKPIWHLFHTGCQLVPDSHVLAPDRETGPNSALGPGTSSELGTNAKSDYPEFKCKYKR